MKKRYFPSGTILIPIQNHLFQATDNPAKFIDYQISSLGFKGFCKHFEIEQDLLTDFLLEHDIQAKRWAKRLIVDYMGGYEFD